MATEKNSLSRGVQRSKRALETSMLTCRVFFGVGGFDVASSHSSRRLPLADTGSSSVAAVRPATGRAPHLEGGHVERPGTEVPADLGNCSGRDR